MKYIMLNNQHIIDWLWYFHNIKMKEIINDYENIMKLECKLEIKLYENTLL